VGVDRIRPHEEGAKLCPTAAADHQHPSTDNIQTRTTGIRGGGPVHTFTLPPAASDVSGGITRDVSGGATRSELKQRHGDKERVD
jgi:hypothetical protein